LTEVSRRSQVGCHYHSKGDEGYAVVQGRGILFFGKVENGEVPAESWRTIEVQSGDSVVIPEGYAHQLRRVGNGDLTILFACPDAHLNDNQDRYMLPDAPKVVGGLSADISATA
jgi:oxalate decarboxylase/phosphoglucose isomerase-like protein (cupin superfamily)